jgi:hypothetical protein
LARPGIFSTFARSTQLTSGHAVSLETVEALEAFRQGEVERRGLRKKPEKGLMFCEPDGRHLNYRSEAKEVRKLLKGSRPKDPHPTRNETHMRVAVDCRRCQYRPGGRSVAPL